MAKKKPKKLKPMVNPCRVKKRDELEMDTIFLANPHFLKLSQRSYLENLASYLKMRGQYYDDYPKE